MSLHKIASEWAVDPRLQGFHQLSFVIQQLLPFILDKRFLPGIWVQTNTIIFASAVWYTLNIPGYGGSLHLQRLKLYYAVVFGEVKFPPL